VLILFNIVFSGCAYAQPGAQTIWDDTDSIGLVVFMLTLAIIFAAALLSRYRKRPLG
jgi:hypothetical protein